MENERRTPHSIAVFGNPRAMCLAALLAAMSLILGKFLQIPTPFSQIVRISFENLPLLLAGMYLGPIAGMLTAVVADLLGCVLYGYAINIGVTAGAGAIGLVAGLVSMIVSMLAPKLPLLARLSLVGGLSHLVGSVLLKTAALAAWYLSSYDIGYGEMMLWRALNYLIIGALEVVILYVLLRHRGFARQLERMCKK